MSTVKAAAADCAVINDGKKVASHQAILSTASVASYLQFHDDIHLYMYQVLNGKQTNDAKEVTYM